MTDHPPRLPLPSVPVPLDRVEIRLLALPLREPMAAAHGTVSVRELTIIGLWSGADQGWGECAALPEPGYSREWAAGAFDVLCRWLNPTSSVLATKLDELRTRAGAPLAERTARMARSPMALAAVEMALLDLGLRRDRRPLAQWLGASSPSVPAGATVGLGQPDDAVRSVQKLARAGHRRIKVKTVPGPDLELMRALVGSPPLQEFNLQWQIDGNGAYGPDDHRRLIELAELGVSVLEQPFPADQPEPARRLVADLARADLDSLVMADEAADSPSAIDRLVQSEAATAVTIKPSRLGGLHATAETLDQCRRLDVPAAAGGMIESGLGRHALAAVAARSEFTLTGDLSPARRWLADDPWSDLVVHRDDGEAETRLMVPSGPGVAPLPEPDLLDRYTIDQITY